MSNLVNSNNIIITGLPRSGTSYLCTRLNEMPNTVIINEPSEIPLSLRQCNSVNSIEHTFERFRTAILYGKAIPNKIRDGKFIEDTAGEDFQQLYTPKFETPDFLLGIKNTLIFLANLPRILEELPGIRVVATLRNPLDTIGSWMNVPFPHLQQANPSFLIDKVDTTTAIKIKKICDEADIEKRMVMLWRFLVKQIQSVESDILILKYEDLITDSEKQLNQVANSLGVNFLFDVSNRKAGKIRKRSSILSTRQIALTKKACGELAQHFGYAI